MKYVLVGLVVFVALEVAAWVIGRAVGGGPYLGRCADRGGPGGRRRRGIGVVVEDSECFPSLTVATAKQA